MIYKTIISLTLILALTVTSCNGQSNLYATADPVKVNRFDKELFKLIESGDTTLQAGLVRAYPEMLDILGKGVLNMKSVDAPGYFDKLISYYSEPTLKGLYKDAITKYDTIEDIEQQLGQGFAYLTDNLPSMKMPVVYMHVSGFNQNVLVGEHTLSLSIDKYMGSDYPLYQDFFYDYQLRKMTRSHVVPDYLTGWLMSEYPFSGKENVLLERMVYEGKMKYLVSNALPDISEAELMGYTEKDYQWCKDNEAQVWKVMIERKHLYTPDHLTTDRYFEDIPSTFLADGAPGNIGVWIGWQIVKQYMENTGATPETLMSTQNAQDILTGSKYKP